jgi:subtilisin family serine protease
MMKKDKKIENLLRKAYGNRIILVASTGNEGANEITFPASSKYVVGVGAIDVNGEKWKFSNYGTVVQFCAPGVNIRIGEKKSLFSSGTSLSAAVITAMTTRIIQQFPNNSPKNTFNFLKKISTNNISQEFCGIGVPKF